MATIQCQTNTFLILQVNLMPAITDSGIDTIQKIQECCLSLPHWFTMHILLNFQLSAPYNTQVGIQTDNLPPPLPGPLSVLSPAPFSLNWSLACQLRSFSTDSTPKGTPSMLPMLIVSTSFSYTAPLPQVLKPRVLKKVILKPTSFPYGLLKPFAEHMAFSKVSSTPSTAFCAP